MVIKAFSGFSKKINSTKQPTGGTDITVRLKDDCSVLNPTFLVTGYNLSHNYIQWGSRYYFIQDIVIIGNELAEYQCNIDVLATYKSVIGSSSQYVLRSASSYDEYIQDGLFPAKSVSNLVNTPLSSINFTTTHGLGTYILGVASEESSGGAISYYSVGPARFPELMAKLFDPTYLNATDITTDLQKELVNPMQYIVSCHWLPFVYDEGTFDTVKFGWWDSGVRAFLLGSGDRIYSVGQDFNLPQHPQHSRGVYLNDSPYTRHTLNCYSFGSIPLNPSPFADGKTGHIDINVDVFTGLGQCVVECDGKRLYTLNAQIGVPVQLAQSTGNLIGSAVAGLESVGSLVAGNPLGATHGVISAISNAMPQVQTQGVNGSMVTYLNEANIVSEFRTVVDSDNVDMGRPLCKRVQIGSLNGFILVERPDIESAGTEYEKNRIMSFMEGGFFYE